MARKQDTRTRPTKPAAKKSAPETKTEAKAPVAKREPKKTPKAPAAASPRAAKAASALEAVRKPVAVAKNKAGSAVAAAKGKADSAGKKAADATKAGKSKVLGIVADIPTPSMPGVPHQVGEALKTLGSHITDAANSPAGRTFIAEMLMFAATHLTKAASQTEAGQTAKSTILNAGAKIGAAAADAGARMVESGKSITETGTAAASSGAGVARDIVREVASVAVGAVGNVVADVATKAISRRRGAVKAEAPTETPAGEGASAVTADAGRRPRTL